MIEPALLGPLAPLVGIWEGSGGHDVSYSHERGATHQTPYRERMTFSAFGPVDNGTQALYGLDYRTAAWREDEEDPFHTEVGYWLWDAQRGEVMRCFMVPRGVTLIAGGNAAASDTVFTMHAQAGSETFGILSNPYLIDAAKTVSYSVTVDVSTPDVLTYTQSTVLDMDIQDELYDHTDRNTLTRVQE